MTMIQVDTQLLLQLGGLFRQLSGQIHEQIKPQLQALATQLEGDWQGPERERYDRLFHEWNAKLDNVTHAGDELGHRLQNIVARLEHADLSL